MRLRKSLQYKSHAELVEIAMQWHYDAEKARDSARSWKAVAKYLNKIQRIHWLARRDREGQLFNLGVDVRAGVAHGLSENSLLHSRNHKEKPLPPGRRAGRLQRWWIYLTTGIRL